MNITRTLDGLLLLLLCAIQVRAGQEFSSFGSAIIDGSISLGEWDKAAVAGIEVDLPEGGTAPGQILVMNDRTNLYLAVQFARSAPDQHSSACFELDKDNSGTLSDGDDYVIINPELGFFDGFRTTDPPCPFGGLCAPWDMQVGGQNDGEGAFSNNGLCTVYEFSHPLCSPDAAHDIQLAARQSAGFSAFIRLLSFEQMADTDLPQFGTIIVAAEPLLQVAIDIRPGQFPNNINPKSQGKVKVAILSRGGFDAPAEVDLSTLTFGCTGEEASFETVESKPSDVDHDGRFDLVCYFNVRAAHFQDSNTSGFLKGRTRAGVKIEGADTIRIVPQRGDQARSEELALTPRMYSTNLAQASMSPNGRLSATAGRDHVARLWKANTGKPVSPPLTNGGEVGCIAVSPDGQRVATGCDDGAARVLDVRTGGAKPPPGQNKE